MGVNKKKIDRIAQYRQRVKDWIEFKKQFNLIPIVEYFETTLKANKFLDMHTGRILGPNEDLMWGFNHKGYQYTLRRQPLNAQANNINAILNQILQQEQQLKK